MSGFWITVDGIDGSGKTTAVLTLKNSLEHIFLSKYKGIAITRGMGSGLMGSFVRENLMQGKIEDMQKGTACALAILSCYDEVKKYLDDNYIVITDRYVPTFFAYNCTADNDFRARILYKEMLRQYVDQCHSDFKDIKYVPDAFLYIDANIKIVKERLNSRKEESSVIDNASNLYFEDLLKGYRQFFTSHEFDFYYAIDNNSDMETFNNNLNEFINKLATIMRK